MDEILDWVEKVKGKVKYLGMWVILGLGFNGFN